jgi:hypothetical protein
VDGKWVAKPKKKKKWWKVFEKQKAHEKARLLEQQRMAADDASGSQASLWGGLLQLAVHGELATAHDLRSVDSNAAGGGPGPGPGALKVTFQDGKEGGSVMGELSLASSMTSDYETSDSETESGDSDDEEEESTDPGKKIVAYNEDGESIVLSKKKSPRKTKKQRTAEEEAKREEERRRRREEALQLRNLLKREESDPGLTAQGFEDLIQRAKRKKRLSVTSEKLEKATIPDIHPKNDDGVLNQFVYAMYSLVHSAHCLAKQKARSIPLKTRLTERAAANDDKQRLRINAEKR